jgi:FtsZ-interacting cell division protein ZipA
VGTAFGLLAFLALVALALYGLWRGRRVKPDGFRHRDWLGNPFYPDDRDFDDRR